MDLRDKSPWAGSWLPGRGTHSLGLMEYLSSKNNQPKIEDVNNLLTDSQVESGENMIFLKYIFDFVFHWKGIYYGQLYYKTCLGILISPPKPQKTAKNVDF